MVEHLEIDFTIIGAGVVGLAVAEALSRQSPRSSVLVLERHQKFGQECSSHNSEVIHAGIYYKNAPLKARHCVRGRDLLYDFCRKFEVPYSACGKFVVATDPSQLPGLNDLQNSAKQNGVSIEFASRQVIAEKVQNAAVIEALWSPLTGIVDSHALMARLEAQVINRGAMVLYGNTFVRPLEIKPGQATFLIEDLSGTQHTVRSRVLINSAGLAAGRIAAQFIPGDHLEIRACRGRYFSLSGRWTHSRGQLIYPLPDPAGGLGVHLTFDLAGKCRLGPDVQWPEAGALAPDDSAHYGFDQPSTELQRKFWIAGQKLLPVLKETDLSPDYVGVRPKLFINQVAHADFAVKKSFEGSPDWHLLGIESPGLTAAFSIAEGIRQEVLEVSP